MLTSLYNQREPLLGYLIVGICWGCTNPFIKKGTMKKANENTLNNNSIHTKGDENEDDKEIKKSSMKKHISTLKNFCMEPRIFLPFLINQSGSLVYYLLLSKEPVSKASPICNALTFILTAITGYVFCNEEIRSPFLLITGCFLVLLGIYFCCIDSE